MATFRILLNLCPIICSGKRSSSYATSRTPRLLAGLFFTHKCFVNVRYTYRVTTGELEPQPLYRRRK